MSGDLEAIGELLDPEVKWHGGDPSAEGACRNRERALAFMRRARSRNPMGELVDVIDAGDQVGRIGYVSAMTLLEARDGEAPATSRSPRQSKSIPQPPGPTWPSFGGARCSGS